MPSTSVPTPPGVSLIGSLQLLLIGMCILFSGAAWPADEIRIGSDSGALGAVAQLRDAFLRQDSDARITLFTTIGSGSGVTALLSGALDVAIVAAELAPGERRKVAAAEIGRTPFVFAVGRNNALEDVTLAQLLEIYKGRTVSWPDGSRIRLILRPASVADTMMLKRLSPEWKKALEDLEAKSGMVVVPTAQEAAERIEKTPGALTTLTTSLIITEKRAVKVLRIDGVKPSPHAVGEGVYPYYEPMIIATLPKAPPAAERFAAFARSQAGRDVLLRAGHAVPVQTAQEPR